MKKRKYKISNLTDAEIDAIESIEDAIASNIPEDAGWVQRQLNKLEKQGIDTLKIWCELGEDQYQVFKNLLSSPGESQKYVGAKVVYAGWDSDLMQKCKGKLLTVVEIDHVEGFRCRLPNGETVWVFWENLKELGL